ncbi:SusC/RagA family TonB-linked outer membrane protein [Emticicia sp. TH156]|uniref:SusC/RagA family TonB-linked outer membrane protein n=1 Tax=Emticicia sp. TH156 TaxID=2067454 RepID=UPI000C76FDB1|nr:SusC/RagA family TonB-linked outer membrane protein [Emticicia sp. TH156]PLK44039.1 SusC/RagA family TonB-linked outer membrane protein [Emticicia sp. TH156]
MKHFYPAKNSSFKLKLLVLWLYLCPLALLAQTRQLSGRVIGSVNKDPMPGVGITVKGTQRGAITDAAGNFKIDAAAGETLVFSFIGYLTQEIKAGNSSTIEVALVEDTQALEEVVVTALGIKKESKRLGYAAETVKVSEIQQNRTVNVMASLEGKIAGLDISPPSSGAGASTKIRLRGQSAFAGANNSPLIVINGLPMDQGARGANGFATSTASVDLGDNMQQFNPDDVESMTVLKGATAAAIYGSRAANGAIIITTKSGNKNTGIGLEYSSNYAADEVLDFTDFQYEYGQGQGGIKPTTQGQAITTGQFGWGAKYDGKPTIQFDGVERPYLPQKNRIKNFYRTGSAFTNTIALSGGNGMGSFRASYSNQDALGISPNNDYHKKIFNAGINQKIGNKLTTTLNINYTNEINNNPPQVGVQGIGSPNFLYRLSNSIGLDVLKEKAVADNGTERQTSGFQTTLLNPYYIMDRQFIRNKRDRFLGTATVKYDIFKWLYLQGRVNMDYGVSFLEQNLPTGVGTSTPLNQAGTGYNGSYGVNTSNGRQMNMDFLLAGNKEFGDFSADVSLGGNIFTNRSRTFDQSVTDFTVRDLYSIENGITKSQSFGVYTEQVNSLYGFAELGYKDMIYLNLTGRNDWFSVLNPKNNSSFYPSVSGSFIFSELLKEIPWLSYGKLRASFADVGSANGINAFSGLLTYGILQNAFNGYPLGTINNTNSPNPLLRPFSVSEREVGLELRMFKSRVNLDIAYYDKQTRDQILTVVVSNSSGYDGTPLNLGSLQNRGMEFMLDVTPVQTGNFTWKSSFNTAINTTKVLALAPNTNRLVVTSFGGNEFIGSLVYEVGQPLNQLAAKTYKRNDKGEIIVNSSGRLVPNDGADVLLGSALPKFTGGWNNTFSYKNLSLLVHLDYKAGGKILSSTALNGLRQGHTKASLVGRNGGVVFPAVYANGEKNTTAVDPQSFYTDYRNAQIADPFLFKSDFIKLRNITLNYDATRLIGSRVKFIKGLALSVSCRNVLIIKKYLADLDPEAFASSGDFRVGYEQTTLPTTRTYGVNLNVKF